MPDKDPNPRICTGCGATYYGRKRQRFCSHSCASSHLTQTPRPCVICGIICDGRPNKKYCSQACINKRNYALRVASGITQNPQFKEEARQRARRSLEVNRLTISLKRKQQYADPIIGPQIRERKRQNRLKNPEKTKEGCRRRRLRRLEKSKMEQARYNRAHPEVAREAARRRRARHFNAPINDFTLAQWEEILAVCKHRCVYCGRKLKDLDRDHLTALAVGGSHTVWNILPACKQCNSEKGIKPPLKPVQPLLLTIAPAKPLKEKKKKENT